jgi:hypothetical protein
MFNGRIVGGAALRACAGVDVQDALWHPIRGPTNDGESAGHAAGFRRDEANDFESSIADLKVSMRSVGSSFDSFSITGLPASVKRFSVFSCRLPQPTGQSREQTSCHLPEKATVKVLYEN